MQLRSGVLKNPPLRTCISPFSIFYKEKANEMKKDGKKYAVKDLQHIISEKWKELDDSKKDEYEEKFEKLEQKYKEELILYYGGSQQDLKKFKSLIDVPPKPKRPISPCLAYIIEARHAFSEANPKLSNTQVTKELAEKYLALSAKEKKKFEDNYEKLNTQYQKDLEEWNKKYQSKSEQLNTLIEEKFQRSPAKVDLDYQELPPNRRPKKLIDNEETEQAQKKADKNAKNEGKGKGDKNKEKDDKRKKSVSKK